MTDWTVHHGDCLEVLRTLPDCIVDAVVTDPPYGLSFMGRKWDYDVPSVDVWSECLRVLKPGGHLLAFAGTRTQHRMCCRIEDAGFEIRDMIAWVYGSGFPKSLDVSKAIDKAAGAERERMPVQVRANPSSAIVPTGFGSPEWAPQVKDAVTAAAAAWQGWGTALKPAWEPICVARKPLIGTVAENVRQHGVGALNIAGCRVPTDSGRPLLEARRNEQSDEDRNAYHKGLAGSKAVGDTDLGRWPANIIHDGSDEVEQAFAQFGQSQSRIGKPRGSATPGDGWGMTKTGAEYDDTGSPSRFFYAAKASKAERQGSKHPTVKPIALMRYLCRLVTPPGGTVLDPFAGTGTTAQAAAIENFNAILIEQEAQYIKDIQARLANQAGPLFS